MAGLGSLRPRRGAVLEVPYTQKEEVKKLGAWWDPEIKKWFVPFGKDTKPFEQWIPADDDDDQKAANE